MKERIKELAREPAVSQVTWAKSLESKPKE